jgi:hypothetical protein
VERTKFHLERRGRKEGREGGSKGVCSNLMGLKGIRSIYAHEYKTLYGIDGRLSMQTRRGYIYDYVPSSTGIAFERLRRASALLVCAHDPPVAGHSVAEEIRQDAA